MNLPIVHSATEAERQSAIQTVVLGFATDPVARWLLPDASTYLKVMPQFVDAFGGRAFAGSSAYVTERCRGVALWLAPGVQADSEALDALIVPTVAPDLLTDFGAFAEQMGSFHPHEPHWYLPLIGVDPSCQGQGLGSALMKHALKTCDEQGLIAYLESSNPRNITLYERHGFQAIGRVQAGSSPVITPMLRQPR